MAGWGGLAQELLGGWGSLAQGFLEDQDPTVHGEEVLADQQLADAAPVPLAPPAKPMVPGDIVHAIEQATQVTTQRPSLTPHCSQALAWIQHLGPQARSDLAVQKFSDFFVQAKKAIHTSKEVVGRLVAEHPSKIEGCLSALANSFLHVDHLSKQALEQALLDSDCTLLLHLEVVKYDETPMKVTEKDILQRLMPGRSAPQQPDPAVPGQAAGSDAVLDSSRFIIGKGTTTAKLFASESTFGYLVRLPAEPGDAGVPPLLLLVFSNLTHLQVLGRATASVMTAALQDQMPTSPHLHGFARKVRLTTVDQAPANALTEKNIMSSRQGWSNALFPCNVHIIAGCHSKSFSIFSDLISGVINFSLSLSHSSTMAKFRQSMAQVVGDPSKFEILRGSSSPAATAFRHFIIDVFCQSGANAKLRAYLLLRLPNGDWQRRDKIEVYVAPLTDVDEAKLRKQVVTALLMCLGGRAFRVYPRHRWIGADAALDQVGICLAIHSLASQTYSQMVFGQSNLILPTDTQQRAAAAAEADMLEDPDLVDADFHDPDPATAQAAASSHAVAAPPFPPNTGAASAEVSPAASMAAANARCRKLAVTWLRSDPLGPVIALRLLLSPLVKLLTSYVKRSGRHWTQEQRARVAQAMAAGVEAMPRSSFEEYLALSSEREFFRQLQDLIEGAQWQHVPRDLWTQNFEAKCFRVSSRMGCSVHQLLVFPCQRCPHRLLKLVLDSTPEAVADFLAVQPCCHDELTSQHIKAYPGELVNSEESLSCLNAMTSLSSTETVGVEWGHGRVHRLITKSSVQTHVPTIDFVGAQWLCQKLQQRHLGQSPPVPPPTSEQPEPQTPGQPAAESTGKRKRGGGGAWRAFVSQQTRGSQGQADLRQLSARYQEAKRLRTPEYVAAEEAGQAATKRHKLQGQRAFGPTARQTSRKRRSQMLQAQASQAGEGGQGAERLQLEVPQPLELAFLQDLPGEMTQIRRITNAQRAAQRSQHQDLMTQLQNYSALQQPVLLQHLYTVCPSLLPLSCSFQFLPHRMLKSLEVCMDTLQQGRTLASWASASSRSCNLHTVLKKDWSSRHVAIVPPTLEEDEHAPAPVVSPCLKMGKCVMSRRGQQALQFRNAMLKMLKQHVSLKDVEQKRLLLDGYLVLDLHESPRAQAVSGWGALAKQNLDQESMAASASNLKGRCLLHIGLHYQTPYRPTFQLLTLAPESSEEQLVCLQTHKFFTDMELANELNLDNAWRGHLLRICSREVPLPHLRPARCVLEEWKTTVADFWPAPTAGRPKGSKDVKPRARRGGKPASEAEAGHAQQEAESDPGAERMEEGAPSNAMASAEFEDEAELSSVASDDATELSLDQCLDSVLEVLQEGRAEGSQKQEAEPEILDPDEEAVIPPEDEVPAAEPDRSADQDAGEDSCPETAKGDSSSQRSPSPPPEGVPAPAEAAAAPVIAPAPIVRLPAEYRLEVPGGLLTYYGARRFFTATCRNPDHGRCVLSRTAEAGRRGAQGRPLGLLTAWLYLGQDLPTKEDHFNRLFFPNHAVRSFHRAELQAMPGADDLLQHERGQEVGEAPEPDQLA